MYRLATKLTAKKRVEENASVSFHGYACIFYSTLAYLLLTAVPFSRQSSRLSGFSERVQKRNAAYRFFRSSRS